MKRKYLKYLFIFNHTKVNCLADKTWYSADLVDAMGERLEK